MERQTALGKVALPTGIALIFAEAARDLGIQALSAGSVSSAVSDVAHVSLTTGAVMTGFVASGCAVVAGYYALRAAKILYNTPAP